MGLGARHGAPRRTTGHTALGLRGGAHGRGPWRICRALEGGPAGASKTGAGSVGVDPPPTHTVVAPTAPHPRDPQAKRPRWQQQLCGADNTMRKMAGPRIRCFRAMEGGSGDAELQIGGSPEGHPGQFAITKRI